MVFSGSAHRPLAEKICSELGQPLSASDTVRFSNDCLQIQLLANCRKKDVYIIQPLVPPTQDHLMELLLMIDAARGASAASVTAVIPHYAYARSDKKDASRISIGGRLVADMLQLAGADRVLTMDLHAGQIQGFFTIPVDHMTALPLFAQHFRDLGLTGEGIVSVAPDAGRAKHAIRFAEMIGADFAIMHKTRTGHDQVQITALTGRVRDKIAIVGDDVTTTGRTQIAGATTLREHGATQVWMFVTHSLLGPDALRSVAGADISGLVVTDTVPIDPLQRPENVTVLTVSGILAETITNVFSDESVSAIFGGENQLF